MKSLTNKIDWKKINGLVPVVIQDVSNGSVLMLGYMDKEAIAKTEKTGFVCFYSRTKKRLWKKGEASGNTLRIADVQFDCDSDALLVRVIPSGPTCHTGTISCFGNKTGGSVIQQLFATIEKRKKDMPRGSYTASLFKAGLDRVVLKVSEESLEVVQAATKETKVRLVEETADLLYHLFVLLVAKSILLNDVEKILRNRLNR